MMIFPPLCKGFNFQEDLKRGDSQILDSYSSPL